VLLEGCGRRQRYLRSLRFRPHLGEQRPVRPEIYSAHGRAVRHGAAANGSSTHDVIAANSEADRPNSYSRFDTPNEVDRGRPAGARAQADYRSTPSNVRSSMRTRIVAPQKQNVSYLVVVAGGVDEPWTANIAWGWCCYAFPCTPGVPSTSGRMKVDWVEDLYLCTPSPVSHRDRKRQTTLISSNAIQRAPETCTYGCPQRFSCGALSSLSVSHATTSVSPCDC